MHKIWESFKRSEIKRQLLTLSIGTSIAQLLPLVFYPVLSRMYSPETFGLLATISSIASIIVVISTGKYEQAILIAKNKVDIAGLVILSLGLSLCLSLVYTIVFFFLGDYIVKTLNEAVLKFWLLFIPILAFLITVYNCYNEWCVKKSYFLKLSINKITNANTGIISKLALGFCKIENGLIVGELLGRFLTGSICILGFFIHDKDSFREVTWVKIKELSLRYASFPKYTMPDQLLNTLGGILPILFFSAYFGSRNLGYYAMMHNILAIPMVFIGQAVMDIFRKKASVDVENVGNCKIFFLKALKSLTIISLTALLIFIIPLPYIFEIMLGKEWAIAGELAQIYAPAAAIGFICNSLSGIWIVKEKLKYRLYWQLYYFGIIVLSLIIGCLILQDIKGSVLLLTIGLSSAYLINIYYSWKFAK